MRLEPPASQPLRDEAYEDGVHAGESWADVYATISHARPGDEHYRSPLPRKPLCPYSGAAQDAWWEGFDHGVTLVEDAARQATAALR